MIRRNKSTFLCLISLAMILRVGFAYAETSDLEKEAESTLRRAVKYFRGTISTNGGYLW